MYKPSNLEGCGSPFEQFRGSFRVPSGDTLSGFSAGLPGYPANFSRDGFVAGILAADEDLLMSQIEISAACQGNGYNPVDGMVPGRIHHEYPGTNVHGRSQLTTYNACDTTALFLIAAEGLASQDSGGIFDKNLRLAAHHIIERTDEVGIYWEFPPDGGEQFSVKVTYWKDSVLPRIDGKQEPTYPVSYSLAHFIAARGLQSAGEVLGDEYYSYMADRMFRAGIERFVCPDGFVVYEDGQGELRQPSSDELHSLAFIPPMYREQLPLEAICVRSKDLATDFGYMCTPYEIGTQLLDQYHGPAVWVHEQALIHYGATKFNLSEVAEVAQQVSKHIGTGQELFAITHNNGSTTAKPAGNDRQLWAVAADQYFAGNSRLSEQQWL